jgi:anti-anti-sigma regulatory factor
LRMMTQSGGMLQLTGLNDQPMKVFRASGIDKLVQIKEVTL